MAKTKKMEKVVDLKPKAEKITDEQLKKVQDTVNGINRAQLEIGSLEIKKHEMMHGVAGLRDELTLLQGEIIRMTLCTMPWGKKCMVAILSAIL